LMSNILLFIRIRKPLIFSLDKIGYGFGYGLKTNHIWWLLCILDEELEIILCRH